MKITVVSLGYVGPPSAVVLAEHNEVPSVDLTIANRIVIEREDGVGKC